MDYLVLGLRLGLAALFATAAAGKLLDRPGTAASLLSFGVPARHSRSAAWLLPATEGTVAVGLLVDSVVREAALAATLLLLLFSGAAARARAAGLTPSCNCFGQTHAEPIDAHTFARNGVLAAAAMTCVIAPASVSPPIWSVPVAIGVGVAVASARHLRRRAGRLQPGAAVPAPLGALLPADRPTAIVFVAADCPPCRVVMGTVERWKEALAADVSVVALDVADLPEQLGVTVTPSAVFVASDGTVESGLARGALAVEALIRARAAGPTGVRT